jgi:LacI family transcriptional regulator
LKTNLIDFKLLKGLAEPFHHVPTMHRRITIRDIAEATGCHYSTVSLALRNDARISTAVRKKVHAMARKLGYRPDPMVRALAVYRNSVKPASDHGTIAWLTNETELKFGPSYSYRRYAGGALARAEEVGYRVEEFALRSPGMTPERMSKILYARGIQGILIAPQPQTRIMTRLHMDLSRFSVVTFGYSLAWPPVHLVTSHHARGMRMAMRKLRSLGYRRIGLCLARVLNGRSDGGWFGSYLTEIQRLSDAAPLEPFLYESWSAKAFTKWYKATKPQAVIVHSVADLERIVSETGLRSPEDIGVVSLSLMETDTLCAGIDQNSREIGAAGVDLLVSLMHANERGFTNAPRRLMIEGSWVDGPTIRRINR